MTLFERLGRLVYHRRWWVIGGWVVLLLLAIPFAPQAPGALHAGGFVLEDLPSSIARSTLERELGSPPSALVVVLDSETLVAGTPGFEAAAARAMRDVPSAPHVTDVLSHLAAQRQVSADGRTAYDVVFLDLPPDDSPDALPGVQAALRQVDGLSVSVAGGPAFYGDVQSVSESDLRRSEIVSLPLAPSADQSAPSSVRMTKEMKSSTSTSVENVPYSA